jgi:HSP20 family protein
MSLVRWDPFRELEEVSDKLNRMFSRPSARRDNGQEAMTVADWIPTVDISETDAEFLIKAELPGVNKDDVKITLQQGILTIQGLRAQEREERGRRFHRVERAYGTFARTFTLPEYVDDTNVRAEFKDGVLTLHVPKSEKAKPKAIEVKVS